MPKVKKGKKYKFTAKAIFLHYILACNMVVTNQLKI